ncbi:hypothetical protein OAW58_01280 [Candidatus Pelagibacter ubique]|nr:hypothetical protein [Candidatus Pelagibacter ubique]
MKKIKDNIIEILVVAGVMLILLYSSSPDIYPDTQRFLSGNLHDPPLYSTIIYVMQLIFGSLNSVIILQTLFIGFGIIYFTRTVEIHFNLNVMIKSIIALFLFLPVLKFYKSLITEPISYAFSLLFVSFVVKLIYNLKIKNIIWITIFVILLLLLRNQFIFLYPVILLLYLGILILYSSKKTFSWLLISFLSIFIIHNVTISTNKHIKKNYFENKSFSTNKGIFFFAYIDAIYISDYEDIELFEDQKLKNTLAVIFNELNDKKALIKYYNHRGHFSLSLKTIRDHSDIVLEDLAQKENTTIINLKKQISIKLIAANFEKYVEHTFKKFYDSTWLFIFIPFFMMLASLISFIKYKSKDSLLILFLSTFALANHSVVYLFGRVQPRYLIYTDFVILVFIFITFIIFLKNKTFYKT